VLALLRSTAAPTLDRTRGMWKLEHVPVLRSGSAARPRSPR